MSSEPMNSHIHLKQLIKEQLAALTMTHKCHEKEREILYSQSRVVQRSNVILLALASSGIVAAFATEEPFLKWSTGTVTFLSLLFNVWQLQFRPDVQAAEHKEAANEFLALRKECRALLTDIEMQRPLAEVRKDLNRISSETNAITKKAPATSPKAYRLARKDLARNNQGG